MRIGAVLSLSHLNTLKIKKGTQSTLFVGKHNSWFIFEAAVQTKLFVSYALPDNEVSFAKHFLGEGAFDTEFGNREHGSIQERRRIKANQFLRF